MLKICSVSFLILVFFLLSNQNTHAQMVYNHVSPSAKITTTPTAVTTKSEQSPCTATNSSQHVQQQEHPTTFLERLSTWFQQIFGIVDNNHVVQKAIPCPPAFKVTMVNQTPTVTTSPTPTPTISLTPAVTVTVTPSPIPAANHSGLIRIMPLGDSITDGAIIPGGYRIALWNDLQADGDHVDFVGSLASGPVGDSDHEGHIGWTIPMLAGSVGSWVSTYQPDIILLNIGANDVDHGDSAANMTANLSRLLANIYAAKPNTYVILSTLIPTSHGDPNTWSSFNASIPGVAAAYGGHKIVVLDMSHALGLSDLADGLHPNMAGYNKMASLWYPVVTTIYKEYTGTH